MQSDFTFSSRTSRDAGAGVVLCAGFPTGSGGHVQVVEEQVAGVDQVVPAYAVVLAVEGFLEQGLALELLGFGLATSAGACWASSAGVNM